jgi:hypothetical protein
MLALPRFQRFRAASGRQARTAFGLSDGHWLVPMVASDQATEFDGGVTLKKCLNYHKTDRNGFRITSEWFQTSFMLREIQGGWGFPTLPVDGRDVVRIESGNPVDCKHSEVLS